MSTRFLLPVMAFFLLGAVGFYLVRGGGQKAARRISQNQVMTSLSKTDQGEGGVTVTVEWEKGEKEFKLSFNTHTFDELPSFEVQKNVVLKSGGQEILPSLWQETSGASHHRAGVLTFPQAPQGNFQLVVKNLAGVSERILDFSP